jgi:hypothetical protein
MLRDIMEHMGEGMILMEFTRRYKEAVEYIQQDFVRTNR